MTEQAAQGLPPWRVVLTGGEATGKTTLAPRLAAHFGVPWSAEFSRGYAQRLRESSGAELTAADVQPIAQGQLALEEHALAEAQAGGSRLVIHDTDLLSTLIYARHYYGSCPEWVEHAFELRRADLYLLLAPDLPWQADGVRDRGADPAQRMAMQALFRAELQGRGLRYVEIGGVGEARLRGAVDAITARCIDCAPSNMPR